MKMAIALVPMNTDNKFHKGDYIMSDNSEHKEIIYLDNVEMSSTLAQLDHGLMESIQRGNSSSNTDESSKSKNGDLGASAVLKAELSASRSSSESRTESEQKFVNVVFNDYQLDMLIDDLIEKKMIASVEKAGAGEFVKINSDFDFFDFNILAGLNPQLYVIFMKLTHQSSESIKDTKIAFKNIQTLGEIFSSIMPNTYLIKTDGSLSMLERNNFRMNQGQIQMLSGSNRKITIIGIVENTALTNDRGMDKFASGDLSKIGGIMPSFADTMLQSIGILNNGDKLIKPIAAYL